MSEPAPETAPPPEGGEGQRISALEAKVDKILDALSGSDSAQPEPAGGSSVAEEIRRQLEERNARDADAAEKKTLAETVAGIQAQLAEKPPAPMPRRVEKLMWGN